MRPHGGESASEEAAAAAAVDIYAADQVAEAILPGQVTIPPVPAPLSKDEQAKVMLGMFSDEPAMSLAEINDTWDDIAPDLTTEVTKKQNRTLDYNILEAEYKAYVQLVGLENAKAKLRQERLQQLQAGRDDKPRLVRGDAIFDEPDVPEAVWGTSYNVLWAKGQGTMIASQQGLGKTTLAQQTVLHRIGARAGRFLGYDLPASGKATLYLAMDRPAQAMGSFKRMVDRNNPQHVEAMRDRLVIWKGPLPFDSVKEPQAFADWVEQMAHDEKVEFGDVIVDSVKDMAAGHSLSSDETGGGLNSAWQELLTRGVDLLLLHHQRKASNGSERLNTLDDVFGSTLLTSGLGSVFALAGTSGGEVVELIHLKQPLDSVDMKIRHNHAIGVSKVHDGEITVEGLLRDAGSTGATAAELARATRGSDGAAAVKGVQRELGKLAEASLAFKRAGATDAGGRAPDRWFIKIAL